MRTVGRQNLEGRDLHGHGQRPLFRVGARERHPRDVEGMRESPKDLSPHHAKVSDPSEVGAKGRKGTVEYVADQVARKASHDRLAAFVALWPCQQGLAFLALGVANNRSDT